MLHLVGDQMYVDYGGIHWFADRHYSLLSYDVPVKPRNITKLPGCPHDLISLNGEGRLIAKTYIKTGTIIEISRALPIPENSWTDFELNKRLWKLKRLPLALLLFGWGSYYGSSDTPNIKYSQFSIPNVEDMQQKCRDKYLISFETLRDVYIGEELTVNINYSSIDKIREANEFLDCERYL